MDKQLEVISSWAYLAAQLQSLEGSLHWNWRLKVQPKETRKEGEDEKTTQHEQRSLECREAQKAKHGGSKRLCTEGIEWRHQAEPEHQDCFSRERREAGLRCAENRPRTATSGKQKWGSVIEWKIRKGGKPGLFSEL